MDKNRTGPSSLDAEEQMNDEGSTGVSSSVVPRVSLCLGLRVCAHCTCRHDVFHLDA